MTMTNVHDPYWSRTNPYWEAAPRQDPIVASDPSGPLSQIEIEQYASDGFYFDDQLLDADEAAQLLAEAQDLANTIDRHEPGVITEPGSDTVRSIFRIHRTNRLFRSIAKDSRILRVVRQILNTEVYVHQSRINFKPAFDGKEFFWHSDFETWHVEDGMPRMRAVSVSINLTENNEFNGPLMLVPGSHKTYIRCVGETPDNHHEMSLKKQEYGVPSVEAMKQLVDAGGIVSPKGAPGSATFFDCNTMHGSVGNLSPQPRTNLFLVYNAVDNALVPPFSGKPPRPSYLGEREVLSLADL